MCGIRVLGSKGFGRGIDPGFEDLGGYKACFRV
jgi:hypothetical protein